MYVPNQAQAIFHHDITDIGPAGLHVGALCSGSDCIASPAEYFRGRTVGLPLAEISKDLKALSSPLVRDGSPATLALEGGPLELDWFKVERLTRAPYKLINRASLGVAHSAPSAHFSTLYAGQSLSQPGIYPRQKT